MFTKSSLKHEFQIFKDHQDYQKHNVDSPAYIPLKQNILVSTPDEEKRRKRNEYAREYYKKNRERVRAQQKEYRSKGNSRINRRCEMRGNQMKVYEFLLAQYNRGEELARGTEIAKALWMNENSVYTAIFHLTKRWYVGRWPYWRYLLLKLLGWEKHKRKVTVENIESTRQVLAWKWYLDELANKISAELITQNKELFEENQNLKEQLQKINEILEWFKSNNE